MTDFASSFEACAKAVRKYDPDRYFSALFAPAGTRAGNPRPHDVARAMAATFAAIDLPPELVDAIIDARSFDLTQSPFADDALRNAYLDATSGNLMRLAARILGSEHDALAHEAGLAYGLAGLLRNQAMSGRRILPDTTTAKADALLHLAKARRMKKPGTSLAAFLPASLVPLYVRNPAKDISLHRRQWALLGGALRGRV